MGVDARPPRKRPRARGRGRDRRLHPGRRLRGHTAEIDAFEEEHPRLLPLPEQPFPCAGIVGVTIHGGAAGDTKTIDATLTAADTSLDEVRRGASEEAKEQPTSCTSVVALTVSEAAPTSPIAHPGARGR